MFGGTEGGNDTVSFFSDVVVILAWVSITICSMILYMSNQRDNGVQLHNALTFLATGVTDRVFRLLNSIGLTSCLTTASRAMECISKSKQALEQSLIAKSYKIRPILCFDNLDILQRVMNTRIEASSHLFHGPWGYFNFLPKYLLKDIEKDRPDIRLDHCLQTLALAQSTPIKLAFFRPDTSFWEPKLVELKVNDSSGTLHVLLKDWVTTGTGHFFCLLVNFWLGFSWIIF